VRARVENVLRPTRAKGGSGPAPSSPPAPTSEFHTTRTNYLPYSLHNPTKTAALLSRPWVLAGGRPARLAHVSAALPAESRAWPRPSSGQPLRWDESIAPRTAGRDRARCKARPPIAVLMVCSLTRRRARPGHHQEFVTLPGLGDDGGCSSRRSPWPARLKTKCRRAWILARKLRPAPNDPPASLTPAVCDGGHRPRGFQVLESRRAVARTFFPRNSPPRADHLLRTSV